MTMRGWLVFGWLFLGTVAVGPIARDARAAAPIDPATLAGAWAGTWENKSFNPHPTGSVNATIAVPDPSTIAITKTTIQLAKQ
jgi:hypothetical protein